MDHNQRFHPINPGVIQPFPIYAHPFQDHLWVRWGSFFVAICYIIATTGAILLSDFFQVLIDRSETIQGLPPFAIWLICAGLTAVAVVATTGQNRVRAHLRRIRAQYRAVPQDIDHLA